MDSSVKPPLTAVVAPAATVATAASAAFSPAQRLALAKLAAFIGVTTVLFARPLLSLLSHALGNELHSHIPLIPAVAAYLFFTGPRPAPGDEIQRSWRGAALFAPIALGAFAGAMALQERLSVNDWLALMAAAYASAIAAGGFLFLGGKWMAAAAFPFAFLIFVVPLPDPLTRWLEDGSVLASADAAAFMFTSTGTPLLRDGTIFALPGIVLEVARECSGIRSSWVLFITSLVATHLFLHSPWRRLVLVAFVIPLAIVRNAFRILVIGLLCVHIGPHMIDSFLHHRGGPIFFVLSLVPLFALLAWLRRGDRRKPAR